MTGDLGNGLRDLAHEGARAREGLEAAPSTAAAVRRRRSVRGGLWAAGAVAGLGLVGAAAAPSVMDAFASDAAPEPAPTLSVTDTVVDHATVAFEDSTGEDWLAPTEVTGAEACGGPLPGPEASSGEFAATFALPDRDTIALDASEQLSVATVEVAYGGSEDLPAISDADDGALRARWRGRGLQHQLRRRGHAHLAPRRVRPPHLGLALVGRGVPRRR
ncbi:hypothetical protein [Demequina activiva]|uniref:Uncharacterized protein n=1 Tax=Demequina activiva TaxID=1582364 RepID=A0A919Q3X3_9MICO|nr:hypothetical protein [Demequina activiva]GIG53838.1 hypothetical protein Dac01nite_05900 [Demequina activiva]